MELSRTINLLFLHLQDLELKKKQYINATLKFLFTKLQTFPITQGHV